MTLPTISVVTPSFNHAEFIEDTIQSVLRQGYPRLEYIVIDGASTDGTLAILERYRNRMDCIVSEPDGGQTAALRKGFERANGEIFSYLNSDDLYEPSTLHEVAAYFEAHVDVDFVYGDSIWIDRRGRPLRRIREIPFNRFIWLHTHNYIPQPSAFWRRELYEIVGGFDPKFDLAMDADLWIRFSEVSELRHVRRTWSRMRLYPEQKNQRLRRQSDAEDELIRRRYIATSGLGLRMRRLAARSARIAWKVAARCYS